MVIILLSGIPFADHFNRNQHEPATVLYFRGTPAAENPLITAVKSGNAEVVRVLVEEGADMNSRSTNFMTALHFAAWPRNEGAIPHLVVSRRFWSGLESTHCF